jgi:flagellar hook assembly protein FlgD
MSFGYRLDTDRSQCFSDGAIISYGLPRVSDVMLEVCDDHGGRVRLLVNGTLAAGDYQAEWDGTSDSGRAAPDGIYRVRLTANAAGGRVFIQARAITLHRRG